MLDHSFTFHSDNPNSYQLTLPIDNDWKRASKRVLVVMQTVDRRDLKCRSLLGDSGTLTTFKNCIKYSRKITRAYKESSANASFAVVNFNEYRHLHLPSGPRRAAESEFANRIHKVIQKLKPTHVLLSGDGAMDAIFPSIERSNYKRGWVHKLTSGDLKLKVVSTLDMARLLENNGSNANLLGFWCRHLANLLLGEDPHSLKHVEAKPAYIDTLEKFDNLMRRLYKSKIVAIDTETANLSVLHNKIYTIQFATDLNPTTGYVLPVYHPETPWNAEELEHIHKKLKAYFSLKPSDKGFPEETVYFNGMYDLRVIRRQFKLPIIWHRVWEITAGEHDLDENIKALSSYGTKPGGLAAVYCSYGNDFYYTAAFSKEERGSIGVIKPNDKNFLMYGATDVVSILHIREQQLAKANHQTIEGKNYKPYFKRHMLHQMSDTAHQLSHLREDGSLVDAKYLRHLIGPDSPLRVELEKLQQRMRQYPQVQEANAQLIRDSGMKSKGLFGKAKQAVNWALSFSKPAHLRQLFFDVMGLEPLSETDGGTPSVDKEFIAEYRNKDPIVDDYGEIAALVKLLGTYAKGWYKKLTGSQDSLTDGHLRPDYSFFDVATGRLASKNPNLQTIPARSKLAKIIKRMFIAPRGYLLVRYDYSAHEVRVWSIASFDEVLAAAFKVGQQLRQAFIKDPSDANKAAIKEKGDIHILNVKRLFNKVVDKSHPLRDAVKQVIFGLLYGKSAKTLGEDSKVGDIIELKAQLQALLNEREKLKAQLK